MSANEIRPNPKAEADLAASHHRRNRTAIPCPGCASNYLDEHGAGCWVRADLDASIAEDSRWFRRRPFSRIRHRAPSKAEVVEALRSSVGCPVGVTVELRSGLLAREFVVQGRAA